MTDEIKSKFNFEIEDSSEKNYLKKININEFGINSIKENYY